MLISIWIPQSYPNFLNGDPGRIAAQVLSGIGFLGAGAIIQSKGSVYGLTTAACIWVVAVIGLAVGAGMFVPALITTLVTSFESLYDEDQSVITYKVNVKAISSYTNLFEEIRKLGIVSQIKLVE